MTSRRNFLTGCAAALAAAAVSPGTARALSGTAHNDLARVLREGGLIENQTFVFYHGEQLIFEGAPDLTIRDCTFIWRGPPPKGHPLVMRKCNSVTLEGVLIDTGERGITSMRECSVPATSWLAFRGI